MRTTTTASIATTALIALASAAHAAPTFTSIIPNGGEPGHAAILHTLYGGAWVSDGALGFTNGSMAVARVADGGVGSPLGLVSPLGVADDAIWAGGPVSATARARFAGDKHTFGWIDDTQAGPAYQSVLNTSTMNTPVAFTVSANFRWALRDTTMGTLFTSRASDNIDSHGAARDQLVTYRLTAGGPEAAGGATWLLMWEDRITGTGSADYDYNDSVIEITAVPAPGALALAGVGGALMVRRKRN